MEDKEEERLSVLFSATSRLCTVNYLTFLSRLQLLSKKIIKETYLLLWT